MEFTHLDEKGQARMVDVAAKAESEREAVAKGRIEMSPSCFEALLAGTVKKGDVFAVARVAGIMAAKRTSEWIPLCHPLQISHASVEFSPLPQAHEVEVTCTVRCLGRTGVEMEALTGATAALLTIYDMCKALDKAMVIGGVYLARKTGGRSGKIENLPPEHK